MKRSNSSHFFATNFLVFSWSDLSSPIKVWLMPLTRLKNFKWFVLQKIILCVRSIVKFLFSDSTIFVTFVASASDKKPSTKYQQSCFCCGHNLKRKEARISLFFSNWNNWKQRNSVFGIGFWLQADVTKETLWWFFFLLT